MKENNLRKEIYEACSLCPRHCGVNRLAGEKGFCGAGTTLRVARAALHHWEEPCISGTRGSGTIFFSFCPLKCVYCQNYELSHHGYGKEITQERLREIYFELIAQGAHNINLVTPTHYLPSILPTLEDLPVPVVMNTGGYESVETLKALEGKIDIYLQDIKFGIGETAAKFSTAPDYPEVVAAATKEMIRQVGPPQFDEDGILQKGVILRHMVLPNEIRNSVRVLEHIADSYQKGTYLLSVMSQYTPVGGALEIDRINRRLHASEYNRVLKVMDKLGLEDGWCQELSSAKEEYIPPFNLEGV